MSSSPICYYRLSYNSLTDFLSKEVKPTKQKRGKSRKNLRMESDSKQQHSLPHDPIIYLYLMSPKMC